mgnify:FL=1
MPSEKAEAAGAHTEGVSFPAFGRSGDALTAQGRNKKLGILLLGVGQRLHRRLGLSVLVRHHLLCFRGIHRCGLSRHAVQVSAQELGSSLQILFVVTYGEIAKLHRHVERACAARGASSSLSGPWNWISLVKISRAFRF